ncbi:MAG: hypothetical protein HYW89_01250 [Candidatus Sungiibacteriota bacterium]|uniref:N-acetyltransferase domain-containing protein n=1 Tax=Candidatus Sungiibacteriota bacterium TaxID=2750080 RepID=A0A7T5UQ75_9BACT|nr:MAG: hypothetical protein HYW89_01250 [Candidatus Sungbacteria bacterium]
MENISLVRYSPNGGEHELTAQLVECYRDVFADGPWHEWLKCPQCQKYWGTRDRSFLASNRFRHCNTPLVDFWPREQVVCDLHHEITLEASCWLAISNLSVIGFCWGYPITIIDLEAKLGVSFGAELAYEPTELVAYQDEVGVLSAYRGRKIAKAMVTRRLEDFLAQDLKVGIVRTRQSPESSETFLWYTNKLGYRILANYPGEDGRVVLGRNLDGLKELLAP